MMYNESSFDMRKAENPDLPIDERSLLHKLKVNSARNPIVLLHCIVMYNENFGQFLQTFAGVVRSIIEMKHKDPVKYTDDSFGVVLICDGIEKVEEEFLERLQIAKVFDPNLFSNNYFHTDVNDEQKARPISVRSPIGDHVKG